MEIEQLREYEYLRNRLIESFGERDMEKYDLQYEVKTVIRISLFFLHHQLQGTHRTTLKLRT